MSDFLNQVKQSASKLCQAWNYLMSAPAVTAIPSKCYVDWTINTGLHTNLSSIIPLFQLRNTAWNVLQGLVLPDRLLAIAERVSHLTSTPTEAKPNFIYHDIPMDFSLARHLAVTGYVCATWSLYDRIANVCGRLATSKDIPNEPWQDPKLWGNLMEGKQTIGGFLIQQPLANAYGWPTSVSYKIRNWLVHDGGDVGRSAFFKGALPIDGFILHPEAIKYLQGCCKYECQDGRIKRCCLEASEEPWPSGDLMLILAKYHGEVDRMLTHLVRWSVDSLVGQITGFSERDKLLFVNMAPP